MPPSVSFKRLFRCAALAVACLLLPALAGTATAEDTPTSGGATFHRRMLEQKVACAQPPTDTFGVGVAQYLDPDGLTLHVAQERRGPGR